jgi:hypothetical protein
MKPSLPEIDLASVMSEPETYRRIFEDEGYSHRKSFQYE